MLFVKGEVEVSILATDLESQEGIIVVIYFTLFLRLQWNLSLQTVHLVPERPKSIYSCFDKGCPKKRKSVRDNAER